MKYLFFIFCLFVFLPYSFSQQIKKYKEDYFFVYGGGEMYGSDPRFIFGVEQRVWWSMLQLQYVRWGNEDLLNLKGGFRILNKGNFEWFIYIPYLNMNLSQKGKYNTPITTDILFKKEYGLGIDIYNNTIVPTLKIRKIIFLKHNKP